jgi:MFS transporter, DHA3 family, macrolide efflux protein
MAATFLLTILSTLSGPVQSTILRELVEKEKFPSVYGNFIALSGVSRLVGQGIAGFLLAWIGTSWSLLTILVVFIFGVLLIQFSEISTKPVNNYSESGSKLRELKEGWNYLINIPYLKWLLITACLANVSNSSLTIAAPAIAKELGNGPQTFSLLTMSLVFGGLICGIVGGRIIKKIKIGLAFGYLNLLTGLFTIIIAFSNSLILTCTAVFLLSFVITMDDIIYESIVMLLTDSRYRGRIKGLQVSIAMLLMPVAMLFGGYIGDLVGVRNLIIISSAFVFLAAIICFANKHVRSVYSGNYEHTVKNETMQIKL